MLMSSDISEFQHWYLEWLEIVQCEWDVKHHCMPDFLLQHSTVSVLFQKMLVVPTFVTDGYSSNGKLVQSLIHIWIMSTADASSYLPCPHT